MFELTHRFTGSRTPTSILELLVISGVLCSTNDIIEVEEVLKDNANDLRFYVNNKLVNTLTAIDSLEVFINSWSIIKKLIQEFNLNKGD